VKYSYRISLDKTKNPQCLTSFQTPAGKSSLSTPDKIGVTTFKRQAEFKTLFLPFTIVLVFVFDFYCNKTSPTKFYDTHLTCIIY